MDMRKFRASENLQISILGSRAAFDYPYRTVEDTSQWLTENRSLVENSFVAMSLYERNTVASSPIALYARDTESFQRSVVSAVWKSPPSYGNK
jgi:hypothetical protein